MKTKTITRRTSITEEIVETETHAVKPEWSKDFRTWIWDALKFILPFFFRKTQ